MGPQSVRGVAVLIETALWSSWVRKVLKGCQCAFRSEHSANVLELLVPQSVREVQFLSRRISGTPGSAKCERCVNCFFRLEHTGKILELLGAHSVRGPSSHRDRYLEFLGPQSEVCV